MDPQSAKALVQHFQAALDAGSGTDDLLAPNHRYRGMYPFYDLDGPDALIETVWQPLRAAMTTLQRRPDMLIASPDHLRADAPVWVAAMGHLIGDFTAPWLGIPPTGRLSYLPYASLYRVENDRIVETVEFLDILAVLTQAGQNPYAADQTGGHIMAPGPKTHDGLTPSGDGQATLDLTVAMLTDLAKSYTSPADHMAQFWHADMTWFGPAGIGASLGFPGYRRGRTGPFEDQLEVTEIVDWERAVAEGNFSAVMWWPCLRMRNSGGYMGVPANEALTEMRVIDLYRRDGDKLAENWIFIDMLHFLKLQGVDLLDGG